MFDELKQDIPQPTLRSPEKAIGVAHARRTRRVAGVLACLMLAVGVGAAAVHRAAGGERTVVTDQGDDKSRDDTVERRTPAAPAAERAPGEPEAVDGDAVAVLVAPADDPARAADAGADPAEDGQLDVAPTLESPMPTPMPTPETTSPPTTTTLQWSLLMPATVVSQTERITVVMRVHNPTPGTLHFSSQDCRGIPSVFVEANRLIANLEGADCVPVEGDLAPGGSRDRELTVRFRTGGGFIPAGDYIFELLETRTPLTIVNQP